MALPAPDNQTDRVVIARLLRPRGNRGELIAEPLSFSRERFGELDQVAAGDRTLRVQAVWWHGDRLILKFEGVDSISAAQQLAGRDLTIPPEQRLPVEPGEYYLADLVGCRIVDAGSGGEIGTVDGWEEFGGPILLRVRDRAQREMLIPFARSICVSIDPEARRIGVVLPEGLKDLNGGAGGVE